MSVHETHRNSRKVYVGPYKVPVREITLSGAAVRGNDAPPARREALITVLP